MSASGRAARELAERAGLLERAIERETRRMARVFNESSPSIGRQLAEDAPRLLKELQRPLVLTPAFIGLLSSPQDAAPLMDAARFVRDMLLEAQNEAHRIFDASLPTREDAEVTWAREQGTLFEEWMTRLRRDRLLHPDDPLHANTVLLREVDSWGAEWVENLATAVGIAHHLLFLPVEQQRAHDAALALDRAVQNMAATLRNAA